MKTFYFFASLLLVVMACSCSEKTEFLTVSQPEISVEHLNSDYENALNNVFSIMKEVYPQKHETSSNNL